MMLSAKSIGYHLISLPYKITANVQIRIDNVCIINRFDEFVSE